MGQFHDMANGTPEASRETRNVLTVSKRRSSGTIFVTQQGRRVSYQQITGLPAADPVNLGAVYRDGNNFLKVSVG